MNAFALPLALMLVCVLLEIAFIGWRRGKPPLWRDVVINLNSGHLLMWLGRGAEVAGFTWLHDHASLHWVDAWPPLSAWVFAFVGWDLGFYWLHRMHHRCGALWAVHAVHHQGEHFNLTLGVRNAWLSSLTSLPFFVPLALLGVSPAMFVVVSGIHYSVQFYNHSSVAPRCGAMDGILITPFLHRVHHGCNPEYKDRNFGGTFVVWDRLFGTLQHPLDGVPIRLGVEHPIESDNPFWVNVVPLMRWLGMREPELRRHPRAVSAHWVATGGLLLFAVVIDQVRMDGMWAGPWQSIWLLLILALTLALGGMSDGRAWGPNLWTALTLAFGFMMTCSGSAASPASKVLAIMLGAHGLMSGLLHAAARWRNARSK